DPDANLKKGVAKIQEAAAAGAQLVCLPELFRSLYFAQHEDAALFDLAEPVPGPTTVVLGKAAQRSGVVVLAPVFERRAPGLYHNSVVVIDADGRIVGRPSPGPRWSARARARRGRTTRHPRAARSRASGIAPAGRPAARRPP